jgi:hypothetical protein
MAPRTDVSLPAAKLQWSGAWLTDALLLDNPNRRCLLTPAMVLARNQAPLSGMLAAGRP